MTVEKTNCLNEKQIQEVKALETLSFEPEGLENHAYLSNEINFDSSIPCFYLGYEGGSLIAFLTTFIPSSQEAEILAVTHPAHRRQGCFKALFNLAAEELLKAGVQKVLFAVEAKSSTGAAALKSFPQTVWSHSEYRMIHDGAIIPDCSIDLGFAEVTANNKSVFSRISREAFPDMADDSKFVDSTIRSENRKGYIANKDGTPVGVFVLHIEDGEAFIYGLGVAKALRGQGFGKQMVAFALKQGLAKAQRVVLDVDSHNPAAFELYKKCGFVVDFQVDYYGYSLKN